MSLQINKYGNIICIPMSQPGVDYDVFDFVKNALTRSITTAVPDPSKPGSLMYVATPTPMYAIKKGDGVFGDVLSFSFGLLESLLTKLNSRSINYNLGDVLPENVHRKLERACKENRSLVPDNVEFRPRQMEIIDTISKNLHGRIAAPPGFGKSFVIAMLCLIHPKAHIVVTTHTQAVLFQLYEDIKKYVNDVGIRCSRLKANGKARVMCVGAKSLASYERADSTDIVFADEVHELGTQASYDIFQNFIYARMFGFSANDKRQDGGHAFMEAIFGPVLTRVEYQEAVDYNAVVQIQVRWIPVNMPNPILGMTYRVGRERYGVWRNMYRNKLISMLAKQHGDAQVLIMVKTVEHAFMLKKLLPDYTVVYGSSSLNWGKLVKQGVIPTGTQPLNGKEILKIKKDFSAGNLKHVIATSVWNRGVDFKQLEVLIRADGADSMISDKQIPGRVSRISSGKEIGIIYDFGDEFDRQFADKARHRKKRYSEEGWENVEFPSPLVSSF